MPPHSMRGQLFCCPHFLPAVAVSTTNYQRLLAPPVPRSRCNHCSFWLKRLASAVQLRPWPPHFKELSGIASYPPSPLPVRFPANTSLYGRGVCSQASDRICLSETHRLGRISRGDRFLRWLLRTEPSLQ